MAPELYIVYIFYVVRVVKRTHIPHGLIFTIIMAAGPFTIYEYPVVRDYTRGRYTDNGRTVCGGPSTLLENLS